MPVTDAQIEIIFRYFDDELSEKEEADFINQLQSNIELQQFFDQQILLSEHLSNEEKDNLQIETDIEPADKFLANIKSTIENKHTDHPKVVPITAVNKRKYWTWVAAAAAIIISFSIYYLTKHNEPNNVVKTPTNNIQPLIKPNDSLPDSSKLLADNTLLPKMYEQYYSVLPEDELKVPSSASASEWNYNNRHYKEMATANENDLAVKGERSINEKNEILNYFYFYKALSNIEINKPLIAEKLLEDLLIKSKNDINLNNQINWYLLMLYLKNGDKENALPIAESISNNKKNKYNKQAEQIIKKLK